VYTAGATRLSGRVDDGSAATDHDEEEIVRRCRSPAALRLPEWGKKRKIKPARYAGAQHVVHLNPDWCCPSWKRPWLIVTA